jgi:hypothetical protein
MGVNASVSGFSGPDPDLLQAQDYGLPSSGEKKNHEQWLKK